MVYFKIKLGMNSKAKEHSENLKYYEDNVNLIVNKEVAEELGYFWGIEELGIHKEGSLVVAGGSNDATSIYSKDIEADLITSSKEEPPKSTQQGLDYKFLLNNLKTI
jgi:hypothetical protein